MHEKAGSQIPACFFRTDVVQTTSAATDRDCYTLANAECAGFRNMAWYANAA